MKLNLKLLKQLFYSFSQTYWLIVFTLLALIAFNTNFYMFVASLSFFILLSGLFLTKKNMILHSKLMKTAMLTDFLIVFSLEIFRGAINTSVSLSLGPLQQAHIYTSSIAILLYIPTLYYGQKRLKNLKTSNNIKKKHLQFGLTAFVFRSLGFFLMFSLLFKDK